MSATVKSLTTVGYAGLGIDIECTLSNNLPLIVIVGYANKAVIEAKERLRGAFANSSLEIPRKRITLNLAPADLPKGDSGLDLAMAVSILAAAGPVRPATVHAKAFIGELGLEGHVRAVRGIIGKLLAGRAQGMDEFYIPLANLPQAQLVPAVTIYPVASLQALYRHLVGSLPIQGINTGPGIALATQGSSASEVSFQDIADQMEAKRGLEIAAAGGHNVLLTGPPGTGKSMLAKATASILPPLSREEMLEVTHLHSLASPSYDRLVRERPVRAPHHSASFPAVIGGGVSMRPGEISLAHRGVLFMDELPEFGRHTIEALRQPLEDRHISLARARDSTEYPANFILIATANPCPCGYYGSSACDCSAAQVKHYEQKLSGPILDRIDLCCPVGAVAPDHLLATTTNEDPAVIRGRVQKAREVQAERFGSTAKLNGDMTNPDIKRHARLERTARQTLNEAARKFSFSARAYMRIIKVARTIADLEQASAITQGNITEAIRYRSG